MIELKETVDLENYVLILPSVAVGNVGQLSIDLIISSLNLRKVGQALSTAFIPVVGSDPYNENSQEICTVIDLYLGVEKKIIVMQIRSPLVNSPIEFFEELQKFVVNQKIAKVIILASSYAHEKIPSTLKTTELRYLASEDILSANKKIFDDLQWVQHTENLINSNNRTTPCISGGGFANKLFSIFQTANIPCAVIFKFCSEGDNIPDALALVKSLNQWINMFEINTDKSLCIKYPCSWKYLFGNPPPLEMY